MCYSCKAIETNYWSRNPNSYCSIFSSNTYIPSSSLEQGWGRESVSGKRGNTEKTSTSSWPAFVQRVLIRLVTELSALSSCQNIGTIPKIHTHSLSQASHGELCVNNQVQIRFHYFRSCVITNSTMQQNNDIVSVSKVFAIFWNVLKYMYTKN